MSSGWISPLKLRQLGIMGMNRRNISYISRYNPRDRYPLVDNKLKSKVVAQKGRTMSVADFRDLLGLSRKYLIPLLEHLDRKRLTRRVGDARVVE